MSQSQTSSISIISISSNSEIENSSDSLSSTSSNYQIAKPTSTDFEVARALAEAYDFSVGSDTSVEICDSEIDIEIEYKVIENQLLKKRTFVQRLQEKEHDKVFENGYKKTELLLKDFEDEILEEKPQVLGEYHPLRIETVELDYDYEWHFIKRTQVISDILDNTFIQKMKSQQKPLLNFGDGKFVEYDLDIAGEDLTSVSRQDYTKIATPEVKKRVQKQQLKEKVVKEKVQKQPKEPKAPKVLKEKVQKQPKKPKDIEEEKETVTKKPSKKRPTEYEFSDIEEDEDKYLDVQITWGKSDIETRNISVKKIGQLLDFFYKNTLSKGGVQASLLRIYLWDKKEGSDSNLFLEHRDLMGRPSKDKIRTCLNYKCDNTTEDDLCGMTKSYAIEDFKNFLRGKQPEEDFKNYMIARHFTVGYIWGYIC